MNSDPSNIVQVLNVIGFIAIPYLLPYIRIMVFNRVNIKNTVVVSFEPPENLPPLICNILFPRYSADAYSSTFLNLVERGVITVIKKNADYELLLDNTNKRLFNYEKTFLEMIFGDKQSILMSVMSSSLFRIGKLQKEVFNDLIKLGISESKYKFSLVKIIAIGLLMNIVYILLGNPINLFVIFMINLLIAPALISYALPYPRLTEYGKNLAHQSAGFYLFITDVQKYRAKFDEKNSLFYTYLPYAVLYRLADIWMQNIANAMFTFDGREKRSMKFVEVYANGKNILNSEPPEKSDSIA